MRARARQRAVLHEAAVEVEQEDRGEDRDDDPAGVAEEEPRKDPADERPLSPRPIVAKLPIGSGPGSASRASAPTIRLRGRGRG